MSLILLKIKTTNNPEYVFFYFCNFGPLKILEMYPSISVEIQINIIKTKLVVKEYPFFSIMVDKKIEKKIPKFYIGFLTSLPLVRDKKTN